MPHDPDDTICFCFHVSRRKIETFCTTQKPRVASEISECLSAGTGCGWCVPLLKHIHKRLCGEHIPWWRQSPPSSADAPASDESMDPEARRAARRQYLAEGKGTPPPGAEL